jgi:hypothetical protein
MRNVPNAVGTAGRIRASSVSDRPIPRMSMKTGTIVTWTGTIMVASTRENHFSRPRNRSRANAYPASAALSIWPIVIRPVTSAELSTSRAMSICWKTSP